MAWTTPVDQATGFLVTAAVYNAQVIDNLAYLHGDAGVKVDLSGGGQQFRYTGLEGVGAVPFQSFAAPADTQAAFKLFAGGAMQWGPGGSTAQDLETARVASGGNAFFELIVGQGLGYGTGVGGTATDVSGACTINKACGQITVASTTITAGTAYSITVTNSVVGTSDVVIVSYQSGGPGTAIPIFVSAVSAGSFKISIVNNTAGSVVTGTGSKINFAVIKGATA